MSIRVFNNRFAFQGAIPEKEYLPGVKFPGK
jgi:hypothetical protein